MTKEYEAEKVKVIAMVASATKKGQSAKEVDACTAANTKLRAEILSSITAAKRSGKINKAEAAELARFEASLEARKTYMEKGGYTMGECHTLAHELAVEKSLVERISTVKPRN